MGNIIDMIAIHKQKRWHKKEEKRFEERFANTQSHSEVVRDTKRERIKVDYQKQIQRIDGKIEKMISKIHNSEEYKTLNTRIPSNNQEKLEVLYKFSKFIRKMYTSSNIEKILDSDEATLTEFQKFQSTLVEIISIHDALEKVGYKGKNSDEIMEKVVSLDFKKFGEQATIFVLLEPQIERAVLQKELEDFLEGRKEIETFGEKIKRKTIDMILENPEEALKIAYSLGIYTYCLVKGKNIDKPVVDISDK